MVYETTLDALKGQTPDLVKNTGWDQILTEADGIKAQSSDSFSVKFEFVDTGEAQNYFQKDKLKLTWNFEAKQGPKKDY
ncbi:Camelysin metallo-endopeptidase [compost metagenome]